MNLVFIVNRRLDSKADRPSFGPVLFVSTEQSRSAMAEKREREGGERGTQGVSASASFNVRLLLPLALLPLLFDGALRLNYIYHK